MMTILMTILITIGSQIFTAEIEDTPTGRDFVAMLPLTIEMEELNGNEKYAYGYLMTRNATSSRQATKRLVDGKVMVGEYAIDGKKLK